MTVVHVIVTQHVTTRIPICRMVQFSSIIFRAAKMTKITSRTTIVPDAESDNKIMIMIAERGRF